MAYDKDKGLIAIAVSKNGSYDFEKLDGYIQKEGYNISPAQRQDLDSYVNGNGKLKRFVMPHKRTKIEVDMVYMQYAKKVKLVKILDRAFNVNDGECNEEEHKVRIRYYNDWKDDYSQGWFYISDPNWQVAGTYRGKPTYLPTRMAFIEY